MGKTIRYMPLIHRDLVEGCGKLGTVDALHHVEILDRREDAALVRLQMADKMPLYVFWQLRIRQ